MLVVSGAPGKLLQGVRAGEPSAFAELFTLHAQDVFAVCWRRTSSWQDAEDGVSLVFLQAWRSREKAVEIDGSLRAWLVAIAVNVMRNQGRAARRYRAALDRFHAGVLASDMVTTDVATAVEARTELASVVAAISRLPRAEREVSELCLLESVSAEQAAAVLRVPLGTVKSRLARARQRLRGVLRTDDFTDPWVGSGHDLSERRSGALSWRNS